MLDYISENLLASVKAEMLSTLDQTENRVADIFEFAETHGVDTVISEIHHVRGALLMLCEKDAAQLCDSILDSIREAVDSSQFDNDDLAAAFLSLRQYVVSLSLGENNTTSVLKAQSGLAKKSSHTHFDDKTISTLQKAADKIHSLKDSADEALWQQVYKITKVIIPIVKTSESYDFIWLIQQLSILNIKQELVTEKENQQSILENFADYLLLMAKSGETWESYRTVEPIKDKLSALTSNTSKALKNDYSPPVYSLLSDEEGIGIVFPISAETIETIAFLIKKELAVGKSQFEKAIKDGALTDQAVLKALKSSLHLPKAAFHLLAFYPGNALIYDTEEMLDAKQLDESQIAEFARNLVLIEDALWGLKFLDKDGVVNSQDNVAKQQAHALFMASNAAKLIVSDMGYDFFKSQRDQLLESFHSAAQLDFMSAAAYTHALMAAGQLLKEDKLAKLLAKTEQTLLFVSAQPELISQKAIASAYLDLLVSYEVAFDQLKSAMQVDRRALKLLENAQKRFAAAIKFSASETMAAPYTSHHAENEHKPIDPSEQAQVLDNEFLEAQKEEADHWKQESGSPQTATTIEQEGDHLDVASERTSTSENQGLGPFAESDSNDASALSAGTAQSTAVMPSGTINEAIRSTEPDEIDEEILDIFIEEAREIRDRLKTFVPKLKDNFFDEKIITEIRRAYHTLKGSGRMVGLNVFGEFAWQHEELLNRAIGGEYALNDLIYELLSDSNLLIDRLMNDEPFAEDRMALLEAAAKAEALKNQLLGKSPDKEAQAETPKDGNRELQEWEASDSETDSDETSTADKDTNIDRQFSDADLEQLADSIQSRSSQNFEAGKEAIEALSNHPALSEPEDQSNAIVDEHIDKIAQTAKLVAGSDEVDSRDMSAMLKALEQIDQSTLNSEQSQVFDELNHIDDLLSESWNNLPSHQSAQKIASAISAMARENLSDQLDSTLSDLSAIKDALASPSIDSTESAIENLAQAVSSAGQTQSLFDAWADDNFDFGDAFTNLKGSTIDTEQRIKSAGLDNIAPLAQRTRETLDQVAARPNKDKPLNASITQPIATAIDEINRVLQAIQSGDNDAAVKSEALHALDNAVDELNKHYQQVRSALSQVSQEQFGEDQSGEIQPADAQVAEATANQESLSNDKGLQETSGLGAANKSSDLPDLTGQPSTSLESFTDTKQEIGESQSSDHGVDEFLATTQPKIQASQENFSDWESTEFKSRVPLNKLRDNIHDINEAGEKIEYIDNQLVTQSLTDTLDRVADSPESPEPSVTQPVKMAIDDLERMHGELADGKSGEASPEVLEALMQANMTMQPASSLQGAMTPDQAGLDLQQVAQQIINDLGTDQAELQSLNAVKSPLQQPPVQFPVSNYLGQAGDLDKQIDRLKSGLANAAKSENNQPADFSELINSVYDVEASMDEKETPSWTWDMLASIEDTLMGMQSKALMPSDTDLKKVESALDALGNAKEVTPASAKQLINDLMGVRAGLPERKQFSQTLERFAESAQNDLVSTDEAYTDWASKGFKPDNNLLNQLIDSVDSVNKVAHSVDYDEATELSQLVESVLSRIKSEQVTPFEPVSSSVGEAIEELSDVKSRIDTGSKSNKIPELLSDLDNHVKADKIGEPYGVAAGEVGANEKTADTEVDQANRPLVAQTANNAIESEQAASVKTPDLQPSVSQVAFSEKAGTSIENSQKNYADWQAKNYNAKEPLSHLTSDVQSINEVAQNTAFQDAEALSEHVSDILTRLADEQVIPSTATAQSIASALDEFSGIQEATAIGAPAQVSSSIIQQTKRQAATEVLGEPVYTSTNTDVLSDKEQVAAPTNASNATEVLAGADLPNLNESLQGRPEIALDDVSEAIQTKTHPSNRVGEQAEISEGAIPDNASIAPTDSSDSLDYEALDKSTSVYETFAKQAPEHIKASSEHFDDWELSEFKDNVPLGHLNESVDKITDIAKASDFASGSQLGEAVSSVLKQIQADNIVPSEITTDYVRSALQAFEKSSQAIQEDRLDDAEISDEFIEAVKNQVIDVSAQAQAQENRQSLDIATSDAISDEQISLDESLTGEIESSIDKVVADSDLMQGDHSAEDIIESSSSDAESPESVSDAPEISMTAQLYEQFAKEAPPHIADSFAHFDAWESSKFLDKDKLQNLNESVHQITNIAEKSEFDSASNLGQSVSGVLDYAAEQEGAPDQKTTDTIESSIHAFDDSVKAIERQDDSVDIDQNLIDQVNALLPSTSEPIDSLSPETDTTDFGSGEKEQGQPVSEASIEDGEQPVAHHEMDASHNLSEGIADFSDNLMPDTSSPESSYSVSKENQEAFGEPLDERTDFNDPQSLDSTILEIFIDEAKDILQQNEMSLADWKQSYDNLTAIQEIQRGMHTLKGGARMAELTVLGDLAHYTESLLDFIVEGSINDKDGAFELLKEGNEASKDMVFAAEASRYVYACPDFLQKLSAFIEKETGKALDIKAPTREVAAVDLDNRPTPSTNAIKNEQLPASKKPYSIRLQSNLIEKLATLAGEDAITRARIERSASEHGFQLSELTQTILRISEQFRRLENETEAQILFRHESDVHEAEEEFDPLELDRFSEIQQLSRSLSESMDDLGNIRETLHVQMDEIKQGLREQSNIQRELQDSILSATLVRFDSLEPRIARIVEQVAKEQGKAVDLQIYGGQVEIERNMLEDLLPGFEHTIRNSLAHGIEFPQEREALGKPKKGRIRIGVRREGAEVWFVIADDGRGADLTRIRDKAKKLGILDEKRETDKNYLLQLLFEAGFSTAETTTQLSGRGIGLDVLREVVHARQGSIEIETETNKGMATSIRLPFTMSVTDALIVKIGQYTYATPIASIEGVARIAPEVYERFLNGETVYHHYGQKRYRLENLLQYIDPTALQSPSPFGVPVLLARVGSERLALQIEDIYTRQEIIVKSVNVQLTTIPGIIGAAILDDGKPVPVVEMATLGRQFLQFLASEEQPVIKQSLVTTQELETAQLKVLVVDDSITMRKVTTKILSRYEIDFKTAKDGVDAINTIADWVPDLILLDIEMPRMDGFEFATHVRNDSAYEHVPIIMITSRHGDKHRKRAAAIGVNGYLGKPYTDDVLIKEIETVLETNLKGK